jgi:hypothetical protein
MAKPTRSAAELNARLTSYAENYLSTTLLNQSFTMHPLVDHLMQNSWDYDGGNEIIVPVLDGYTPTGGWHSRGGSVNLQFVDHATQARYTPKFLYESIVIDWTDEQITKGPGAALRFVEDAINAAVMRIWDGLAQAICDSGTGTNIATYGPGSTGTAVTALRDIIDATGAIGGINPATAGQTFWAAYEKNSLGSFTTNGPGEMRKAWLAVTKYKGLGNPTAIFMSTTSYRAYQASGLSLATVMRTPGGNMAADIGTGALTYNGVPVFYEPHLDTYIDTSTNTGIIMFVNNKGVRLAVDPSNKMKIRPFVDLLPSGQLGRGSVITLTTELLAQARSPLAVITDASA